MAQEPNATSVSSKTDNGEEVILDKQSQTPAPAEFWAKDPDSIALAEAQKQAEEEAKAEQKAPDAEPKAEPVKTESPPVKTETKTEPKDDEKGKEPQIMVPKARLDEALRKAGSMEAAANYFKGIADTAKDLLKNGTSVKVDEPKTEEPTVDQKIEEIDKQKLAIAEKYEAGEITFVEATKQQTALDRDARKLLDDRNAAILANVKAEAATKAGEQATQVTTEQDLNKHADMLETQHPYLKAIDPKDEGSWAFLRQEAKKELAAEGVALDNSVSATKAFRERIAVLSDKYGELLTGKKVPATSQPKTSAITPEDRKKKLDIADQQPPSASNMGSSGVGVQLTDADIEKMSEDQIADALKQGRIR